jgi:hypothetical protein
MNQNQTNGELLRETQQIRKDLQRVQAAVAALQARLDNLVAQLEPESEAARTPKRFADLEGIWAGVDLSLEEIQAVEYRLPKDAEQ